MRKAVSLPFLWAEQWELASPVQPNLWGLLHLSAGPWKSRGNELHLCVVNGMSCTCVLLTVGPSQLFPISAGEAGWAGATWEFHTAA